MKAGDLPEAIQRRLIVAGLLVIGALVLIPATRLADQSEKHERGGRSGARQTGHASQSVRKEIDAVIDTLLMKYRIEKEWVKSWQVQTPEKGFLRSERRVLVPPDFVSLSFNLDLNRMLSDYGARAIASERTKESIVTMHVVKESTVLETLSFVVTNELPQ
jgi:hypothetical protein